MTKLKVFIIIVLLIPFNVFANSSKSTVIMDIDSGRILYSKNSHEKSLIASTTKIMTCLIVLENSDIEKEIIVGDEVREMVGTNIYIKVGEKIKIKDLLYGLMLRSGNDAAESLAYNTLGYDNFIKKMNDKAKEIGMNDTVFSNPHGLDDKTMNYSTAYDMALLSRYAYKNDIYKKIISTKKYTTTSSLKSYSWYNRMSLINNYKKCIGGKNGYTPKAGKSLVSYAKDKNLTLSIVTLDDSDIYSNHKKLYEKYFSKYDNYVIVDKNSFSLPNSFYDGKIYIKNSFIYPLEENELEDITTLIKIHNVTKNNVVGNIIIKNKDKQIGKINVYKKIQNKKKDKNIFQKLKGLFIR